MTAQEYLEWEAQQEEKHEFDDGQVWAMAGVSANHDRITMALAMHLAPAVGNKGCEAFGADVRVTSMPGSSYYYPDFKIVCGEPSFEEGKFDTLLNPKVIVEVLSPSTEQRDRVVKFLKYRQIPSLTDYILISQDQVMVDHYTKTAKGWLLVTTVDIDANLEIPSLDVSVPLQDLYAKVVFPSAPGLP